VLEKELMILDQIK